MGTGVRDRRPRTSGSGAGDRAGTGREIVGAPPARGARPDPLGRPAGPARPVRDAAGHPAGRRGRVHDRDHRRGDRRRRPDHPRHRKGRPDRRHRGRDAEGVGGRTVGANPRSGPRDLELRAGAGLRTGRLGALGGAPAEGDRRPAPADRARCGGRRRRCPPRAVRGRVRPDLRGRRPAGGRRDRPVRPDRRVHLQPRRDQEPFGRRGLRPSCAGSNPVTTSPARR